LCKVANTERGKDGFFGLLILTRCGWKAVTGSKRSGGEMDTETQFWKYIQGMEMISKEMIRLLELCKDFYDFLKEKSMTEEFFSWQVKRKRDG